MGNLSPLIATAIAITISIEKRKERSKELYQKYVRQLYMFANTRETEKSWHPLLNRKKERVMSTYNLSNTVNQILRIILFYFI